MTRIVVSLSGWWNVAELVGLDPFSRCSTLTSNNGIRIRHARSDFFRFPQVTGSRQVAVTASANRGRLAERVFQEGDPQA